VTLRPQLSLGLPFADLHNVTYDAGIVTQGFASFFGGTSLLIMVGVILDTLQQIETQLLMRQYDGLMKSGRIQGRQNLQSTTI